MTTTALALLTRDLRVHDNPTLSAAAAAGRVVPLFVLDRTILRSGYNAPNRAAFLADALTDLDASLRDLGGGLVVREGDVVEEVAKLVAEVRATEVHVAGDVSGYAQRRRRALAARCEADGVELHVHDDATAVVPPGGVLPSGSDHFAVFTPYHRAWSRAEVRAPMRPPRSLSMPKVSGRSLPKAADICSGGVAPELPEGGETAGRAALDRWLRNGIDGYEDGHDAMADDATSRLSPYLHFGCLSAREVVARASRSRSSSAQSFVRQVAWRDFNGQVLAARPDASRADYRPRGDRWRRSEKDLAAWQEGRTGYPIVDAGMRQLVREGWMHNRARLITASFLTKTLYIDWRSGAEFFMAHLVDGDVANNQLNWQWVAGTGTDTRPNRVLNPLLQAKRYDPSGDYVRRYVPELADLEGASIHEPWKADDLFRTVDYPAPIVDLDEGRNRFLAARKG